MGPGLLFQNASETSRLTLEPKPAKSGPHVLEPIREKESLYVRHISDPTLRTSFI